MRILMTFLLLLSLIGANEYIVVLSKKSTITKLTKTQIRDIYLKKREFIESTKVVPINLLAHDTIRIAFEKRVLNIDREEINNYWIEQHYHGVRPPLTQKSTSSLKAFLLNVEGSIGYLKRAQKSDDMRVVYEF
jgi:ABC-type phosphate transport system substrate-binding protein